MSDSDVVQRVIARLVEHADERETQVIHGLACAAGYLWRCGNTDCHAHNARGQRYCEGCGWGRAGRPVGDITPSLYEVPQQKWRALRRAVVAHFEQLGGPVPDAVVFDYFGGPGWRGAEVRAMHGGRSEEIADGFRDRNAHEDIAAALDGLSRFEKPAYCEHMRLVLSS
ncbi:hypothetical protein [Streptomyces sp. MZ04]|uniref:hypothetical protein n=1 Tax=Streptomyces sp. MZ04 TaxID=2559236 RepID=UPI00107E7649|nr:hypothetical protein [Streptomyces sp. MZ04]TGA92814.1 hypothetical protein E2651_36235 [Streptomyces sp. MZ04]